MVLPRGCPGASVLRTGSSQCGRNHWVTTLSAVFAFLTARWGGAVKDKHIFGSYSRLVWFLSSGFGVCVCSFGDDVKVFCALETLLYPRGAFVLVIWGCQVL